MIDNCVGIASVVRWAERPSDPHQRRDGMATVTIAAVQAAYILMDQRACVEKAIVACGLRITTTKAGWRPATA